MNRSKMRVSEALPREKLLSGGVERLTNEELLAVMLGSGVAGKDVRKLAREIARIIETDFPDITLEKLCAVHGMGTVKASQIVAALTLSRRLLVPDPRTVTSARNVYDLMRVHALKKQEHFWLLTLDGASKIIRIKTLFIGTLTQSIVHPREVFAEAIADRAAAIIVVHNHPSGSLVPSEADKSVTHRLAEAGQLLGIELKDHLIISSRGYYSFSQEGLV